METCGFTLEEAGERRVGELVMAVGCVVCTTYTGDIDDVERIDQVLVQGGWDIPIHVDAAAGLRRSTICRRTMRGSRLCGSSSEGTSIACWPVP
jgi:hypothetical protein